MRWPFAVVVVGGLLGLWMLAPAPPPDAPRAAPAWVEPEPSGPQPSPVEWLGSPPMLLCADGVCETFGSPGEAELATQGTQAWSVNVTLEGDSPPGGPLPSISLQAGHLGTPCGNSAGCSPPNGTTMQYREVAHAGGGFPVRLTVAGLKLRSGETTLRFEVDAVPPPGATGWLQGASPWHLHGTATPTPPG